MLETVWAFVGMRRYRDELVNYLKYKKHISMVETRLMHLRNKICKQAVLYGDVDSVTRQLYQKYIKYLKTIRNGTK